MKDHAMALNAEKHGASASGRRAASPELLTNLKFRCPDTARPVGYEVPGDARTLKDLWARQLFLTCPHCGKVHCFSFREAYVQGMLTAPGSELEA
jgi:hypothetical protein